MTPKEILFATFRREHVPSMAWVPFAGVHAGKLTGTDADVLLTDPDKLFDALMKVNELYRPSGQPVLFDLQIEAECLGCDLVWAKNGPPSVASHPLEDDMSIPCECTIPTEKSGRIPMALEVMRRMKEAVGETTALYGLICGPFTLASHLRGNDIFMDMYDDEAYCQQLLAFCNKVAMRMADLYVAAGMDVIAVVDPMISQISVSHFEQFMAEPFTALFEHIRALGALSAFFVCGDATRNIESMCKTRPDSVSVDENVNLAAAKAIADRYGIAIGGNIPLTTVLLHGTQQDVMKCVVDLLDSVQDRTGLIVAPGCDMPYDVPVENGIAVSHAVLHEAEVREMLKNYVAVTDDIDIELPDYANLSKPLVEVFTRDSATCAACGYMMGAANRAKADFGDRIDMVEYKFTEKDNIARCRKMGVPNLPSLYINGVLKYRSLVPSRKEVAEAIEEVMK
jgi:uroporphyrinogen decarboxylase